MTTETVTDERYTRGVMFTHVAYLSGVIAGVGSVVLFYMTEPTMSTAAGAFGLLAVATIGFTAEHAKMERGFCYRCWRRFKDEDWWVLEDVEQEELVDGPVEVEVNDD